MHILRTQFQDKDIVKALGARWDAQLKTWYVPDGVNLDPFKKWLDPSSLAKLAAHKTTDDAPIKTEKGISLFEFIGQASVAIKGAMGGESWIQAEVSQFKLIKGSYAAIELVEHDDNGNLVVRTKAFIWSSQLGSIVSRFTKATGGDIQAGMKILVKAKIELHFTNNIQLIISDVDPSYTLGDIEAKLNKIRSSLHEQGIFNKNKLLTAPLDYLSCAVISPDGAAGLGDFRRDADILESHGICQFKYFTATFQGEPAAPSIVKAIKAIEQNSMAFDVICIIRGGGSVTDLYWLNDEAIAKSVCECAIPVYAGIGHERDNTIIDEVAHTRFDTPSKVIAAIRATIQKNVNQAELDFQAIEMYAQRLVSMAERDTEHSLATIKQYGLQCISEASVQSESLYHASIKPVAQEYLYRAEHMINQAINGLQLQVEHAINSLDQHINKQMDAISTHGNRLIGAAEKNLNDERSQIFRATENTLNNAELLISGLGREVLGMGPASTLSRGYALIRNSSGQFVTTQKQARSQSELTIEFQDGQVIVQPVNPS